MLGIRSGFAAHKNCEILGAIMVKRLRDTHSSAGGTVAKMVTTSKLISEAFLLLTRARGDQRRVPSNKMSNMSPTAMRLKQTLMITIGLLPRRGYICFGSTLKPLCPCSWLSRHNLWCSCSGSMSSRIVLQRLKGN